MEEFTPPINTRETEKLLHIVANRNKWNPKAVSLARTELKIRKISFQEIKNAEKIAIEFEGTLKSEKANESFTVADFIFYFGHTLIILLFSWELRKYGYLRKAKQQKNFRIVVLVIIFCYMIYSMFN